MNNYFLFVSTNEPTQGDELSNIDPKISLIGTGDSCSSLNVLGTYLYSVFIASHLNVLLVKSIVINIKDIENKINNNIFPLNIYIYINIFYIYMNFKKFIFLSFITPFIEPLNLNYYIQTDLNNYELFTNNNLKTILKLNEDIEFTNNDIVSFDYNSYVTGIKVKSKMTLFKNYDEFKIQINNYYMNNTITFKKNNYDTLHINLVSNSKMNIPRYIHKKILNKKINQIINIIQTL